MTTAQNKFEDFLIARGGPFYELQVRLGIIHQGVLRVRDRALCFVGLAWAVPLLLSMMSGQAWGTYAERPFMLDAGTWAKFFVATGSFILIEGFIEERLRWCLREFVRAPIIAPSSLAVAAEAVNLSLRRRDSRLAEAICLLLAVSIALTALFHALDSTSSSWAVHRLQDNATLTPAGWWNFLVSVPIFWFLLLRGLWRHVIWSLLLRQIAKLKLRLVVSHPDGKGGLAFVGQYPNAYALFVFGMSCVLAAAILKLLLDDEMTVTIYGYIMGAWLAFVLALVALPLIAFVDPLSQLKRQTLLVAGAQATRFHRHSERKMLGNNVASPDESEILEEKDATDSSKQYELARKMSVYLLNRAALLPVTLAAILPLAAAGTTKLPYKEIFTAAKRLLLL